jgi:hypothetical protein
MAAWGDLKLARSKLMVAFEKRWRMRVSDMDVDKALTLICAIILVVEQGVVSLMHRRQFVCQVWLTELLIQDLIDLSLEDISLPGGLEVLRSRPPLIVRVNRDGNRLGDLLLFLDIS